MQPPGGAGTRQARAVTLQGGRLDTDVVVVGAGPAGSLMAIELAGDPGLAGLRVVLVDRLSEPLVGRWWAYWAPQPLVRGADSGQWSRIHLQGADRVVDVRLTRSRYRRMDGGALAEHLAAVIAAAPGVRRVLGAVEDVGQSDESAIVRLAGGDSITTRWVLDSTAGPPVHQSGPWLSFLGWRVWPEVGSLDLGAIDLMDFRVPQRGGLRFGYVLPETAEHSLLELCSFRYGGPDPHLARDISPWISERLQGHGFRAEPVEDDSYPLLSSGPRRLGPRVLAIGHRGGLVRPSTGYGLVAYARDAAAVARSLSRRGHPFDVPPPSRRDRVLDLIALEVLRSDPAALQAAYLSLFAANPPERVLQFLDGTASNVEVATLVGSMPIGPFTRAAVRSLTRNR